jgi:hypothetical protein
MKEYWAKEGGEEAREKFYDKCGTIQAEEFRRQDAFTQVKFRILNEHAGAKDRTCDVFNFFKCPYGAEYDALIDRGRAACELLRQLQWYDAHWNRNTSVIPAQNEMKWYHFGEPGIIDVTNFDDVMKAAQDGRIQKVAAEHEAYHKAMA